MRLNVIPNFGKSLYFGKKTPFIIPLNSLTRRVNVHEMFVFSCCKIKNMKRLIVFLTLSFLFSACYKGEDADLVVYNARIHTMDKSNKVVNAMAIKDGKILETGPEREIRNKYSAVEELNAENKTIYPGLHDAHGHIFGQIKMDLQCELTGSTSYAQMITRIEKYINKYNVDIVVARGWDQSIWGESELPTNEKLNDAFPDQAVVCTRVDGHSMLINEAAVKFLKLNLDTLIEGGEVHKENGKFTGVLLDNAMNLVYNKLPEISKEIQKEAIKKIQNRLLEYGITNVHEAGISMEQFKILDEMASNGELKIGIYAMLFPSDEALEFFAKEGHYQNGNLKVRSIKIIGDGALGSRGACLVHPYNDHAGNGFLTTSLEVLKRIAKFAKAHNIQVNTHCIGDSTNRNLLHLIDTLMQDKQDHRWRIEHAQVIHENDIDLFAKSGAIPSVQPTHALSDMRWAKYRLGDERLENSAYLYKSLMQQGNIIAFGTDFPIENYNPFLTIHAAVQRKNAENLPEDGFMVDEAVSLDNCMRAMTIWAAIASFQEDKLGSLEKNKDASFVILDYPLTETGDYKPNNAWKTVVKGKTVFSLEL